MSMILVRKTFMASLLLASFALQAQPGASNTETNTTEAKTTGARTTGASTTGASSPGAELYERRCAACHRGNGPGVFMLERRVGLEQAILEDRDNLTVAYLAAVVRNGIGSMPRFSRGELTDDELQTLSAYLVP